MEEKLVSIVIPVYNASKYLHDTMQTIINQTYKNWEAIFVDDCSKDDSLDIIKKYQKEDKRIKLIVNDKNSGAAITRNNGINSSNGDFLCFLDSDDLWEKEKLEKQIVFMEKKDIAFSFTGYEFVTENGNHTGKQVDVPSTISYKQALKNTTIWTSTVMFNMSKLSKEDINMPNVRRGQDTATWWKILKKIDFAYGLKEILSYYRRGANTLSSNKIKALKRTWYLYRNIEHLNVLKSSYYFIWYCFNAIRRRV